MKLLMSALFMIAAVVAADLPDFSGKWKIDADKSVFGPMPPPASMSRVIEQKAREVSFTQTMAGPDMEMEFKFPLDGSETVNSFMGSDYKSKSSWDGKTLVLQSRMGGDAPVVSISTWKLSEDGKTLTEVWKLSSPQGDMEVTYVMVRQ